MKAFFITLDVVLLTLQAVRRTIDKKTVDVFRMFNEELNAVKKELTMKAVPRNPSHPKYSGAAHWARTLKRRIERGMMVGALLSPMSPFWLAELGTVCSFSWTDSVIGVNVH